MLHLPKCCGGLRHSSRPVKISFASPRRASSWLTQNFEIATKAKERHPIEAMKGALAVPMTRTRPSAKMPANIATRLLNIVMALNIPPRTEPESSSMSWLNSATSQLSKTLQSRVPHIPPSTRPRNNIRMSSASRVKLENEYRTQYAKHAVRRPYRSANVPANDAEIPAETNPMRNRNATVSSGRPFSSKDGELTSR